MMREILKRNDDDGIDDAEEEVGEDGARWYGT